MFSNVAMLKDIVSNKKNKRHIRDIIILCCRILTVICIVFAFAQPYKHYDSLATTNIGTNYVSIFVDNSFSMNRTTIDGNLLDLSKKTALNIVKSYKQSDRFHLSTQDRNSDYMRFYSQSEIIDAIEHIEISPMSLFMSDIYEFQQNIFNNIEYRGNKLLYIISDFQKNICDFENINPDNTFLTYICPLYSNETANISIDSLWLETPILEQNSSVEIFCNITNYGNNDIEDVQIKLYINDNVVSFGTVSIPANQSVVNKFPYTIKDTGFIACKIELADYPIQFDDAFYFTMNIVNKIRVLQIYDNAPNPHLSKIFKNNNIIDAHFISANKIDYSSLKTFNFVILDGLHSLSTGLTNALYEFVKNGGSIMIEPDKNIDITSYNNFLKFANVQYDSLKNNAMQVSSVLFSHSLFNSAFMKIPEQLTLPTIIKHYPIDFSKNSNSIALIYQQNATPFLLASLIDKGHLYVYSGAFDDDFGDYYKQPLFVISTINMAFQSITNENLYSFISNNANSEIIIKDENINAEKFVIRANNSEFEVIPYTKIQGRTLQINSYGYIKNAGNYSLFNKDNFIAGLSYNYDRKESVLESYTSETINKAVSSLDFNILNTNNIATSSENNPITPATNSWKLFVVLALLFLLTESLVSRFMK
ncbi:membrane protein [Bacteroidia bacterium]|nr:membrane protein [Bacteroidia bacterium]